MSNNPKKAVALISGGLDSMLAARLMQDQGIHVEGINFFTGFCVEGHTHAIREKDKKKNKRNNALWVAEQLDMPLHIVDIVDEYKDVLINPKHGYGANMNPCLDCKVFMVSKAYEWIKRNGFDFIITGEVVGQRPMSQLREKMKVVEAESGAGDVLVRPLSGKNLPATKPEREGWIDRDKLYDISGRQRKIQMQLAQQYGYVDYASPAGGCCFLTDEAYSKKLVDMWSHRGEKEYDLDDVMLLKVGRHIRPKANFKLIIGREQGENRYMEGYRNQFPYIYCESHKGPLTLVEATSFDEEDIELAAKIVARFSQSKAGEEVTVHYVNGGNPLVELVVTPFLPQEVQPNWYV